MKSKRALFNTAKLALLSGGFFSQNRKSSYAFINLSKKRNKTLTFIPCSSDDGIKEFEYLVKNFGRYGVKGFVYFPIDEKFSPVLKERAFASDLIFIGGGNTFYLLKNLKKKKLFTDLKNFLKKGGVLGGLSAGAIVLSKTIRMAAHPSFDRDSNDVKLKDLRSLGLVPFEIFPHYEDTPRYRKALRKLSQKKRTIYALRDGAAIICDKGNVTFLGKVKEFKNNSLFDV